MSKRNSLPRSSRPPQRPSVSRQSLQPKASEKQPPPNPHEQPRQSNPPKQPPPTTPPQKPPPPTTSREQIPAEMPIRSIVALPSSRALEPKAPRNYRKRHIASVYVLHAVLTLFAVAQLVTFLCFKISFEQLMGGLVASLLLLLLAVAVLLILAFVKITNTFPVNYLLAVVIVELNVLFVNCHRWTKLTYDWMGCVLAIVLVLNLVLYLIGIFAPLKFLPNVSAVMIIGCLFIIAVVSIIAVVYINGNAYLMRYVSMLTLCYVSVIAVFTVTVVHQRRFDYVALGDHVLHATMLSSSFVYMTHAVATIVEFGDYLVEQI